MLSSSNGSKTILQGGPLQRGQTKGGPLRKWWGNLNYVVNWENDGAEIFELATDLYGAPTRTVKNLFRYFRSGATWTDISAGQFGVRKTPSGFIFDTSAPSLYAENEDFFISLLNSKPAESIINALCPSLHYLTNDIGSLPLSGEVISCAVSRATELSRTAQSISAADWDAYETSWDFIALPLLQPDHRAETLEATYIALRARWQSMTDEMQALEEENNRIFIDAYALQDELTAEVPVEEITLTCNPAYRYGVKGTEEERKDLQQRDTMRELISYAVGCMMGRYSLVEPGLIYANAGNLGFDSTRYGAFHADDDGIVPITDVEWFPDDATARFIDFLRQTFGDERLGENLDFVADSIEPKRKVSASETIRKYVSRSFFKDHLRTYKNRPIYWLFSSGRERAFECLVYLHRYNESTLGRMRAEYVIPLQTKMQNRIQTIEGEISRGDLSSALMKARTKELAGLEVKKSELDRFEANLRHMAEERISLDLDDGVKVNYGKFGDLLAETKLICGSKDED